MSRTRQYHKRQAKAIQRWRYTAAERLAKTTVRRNTPPKPSNRVLDDLRSPEDLVTEIKGRLHNQCKLQGKMVEVMFPSIFGCRTNAELCRVRG
jgi:hypothetical protein